ncbi:MAG TPA: ribonuclease E/G [Rhizomicrobium sp.]|nr:ribonuclease E/G [Rhizomicrobium sp.]
MSKRMLIDASHPEETRVVVLDGSKVEEFDFEAASKRPLKGNIYLAKVTRVEPSLQAAFVEYGGNRQGFLAFSEIHPDYYQIPVADRQALLAEQEAEARRRQEDDIESFEIGSGPKSEVSEEEEETESADEEGEAEMAPLVPLDAAPDSDAGMDSHSEGEIDHIAAEEEPDVFVNHAGVPFEPFEDDEEPAPETKSGRAAEHLTDYQDGTEVAAAEATMEDEGEIEPVEDGAVEENSGAAEAGDENAPAEAAETGDAAQTQSLHSQRPPQKWVRRRHYKIQEVIKRRQIILVQVVKEERGNKGAALTTYLSLAGRYCVLMPNTPRGGGISRKITNAADRKRLKSAAQGLELPEGMGLIIRTAGENRTKLEIRRDYEYLMRLWDTIREKTLASNAPACVYEEGDLIKRAIRDLYNTNVQDVIVEGDEGYHNAKDFMRMLMPSHARHVHQYKDGLPLFQRMHIESQLDSMFSPSVTLKSGGYLVINQTEALVSIDVNSGRATREHSIEETARKTNLEAAAEVGRQLRLRDLAGLIVIDFIDMEDGRNDREVEKRLRDAVKNDRARVQIGKISQFGLLEMSRQRLRAGVVAGSTVPCPPCGGQGIVRSVESTALRVLRALEEEGEKNRAAAVKLKIAADVAIYVLNQKRRELARIEAEHGMEIEFLPAMDMQAGSFEIDRVKSREPGERPRIRAVGIEAGFVPSDEPEPEIAEEVEEEESETTGEELENAEGESAAPSGAEGEARHAEEGQRRRRRRGGRGRNRDRGPRPEPQPVELQSESSSQSEESLEGVGEAALADDASPQQAQSAQPSSDGEGGQRRRRRRRGRRGGRDREHTGPEHHQTDFAGETDRFGVVPDEIDTTPTDDRGAANEPSAPVWSLEEDVPDTTPREDDAPSTAEPRLVKKGWWQRTFSGGK